MPKLRLYLFALLSLCVFSLQAEPLRIGSGHPSGDYYRFASQLAEVLGTESHTVVATRGTVDNIRGLGRGELDIALVQNDIAHYSYYGKNGYRIDDGFAALVPLFPEYVQILVRRDDSIRILRDLQNRSIALGPRGSGSHRNAMDVLAEIGMQKGIDYLAVEIAVSESIKQLKAGEVDAVFITGQPYAVGSDLSRLAIPPAVIDSLSAKLPYYGAANIQDAQGIESETLSVTAYLVASKQLDEARLDTFLRQLVENWNPLRKEFSNLLPLERALIREPFPFHPVVVDVFEELDIVDGKGSHLFILVISTLFLFLTYWAKRRSIAYDRMGNEVVTGGAVGAYLIKLLNKSGMFLYVIFLYTLVLSSMVILLQYFEASYAREMNIDNPFAFISFTDAFLWMFTFMGSGFTTDDLYPSSPQGMVLVAAVPFIGVTSLIGVLIVATNRVRESALSRMRGMAQINHKGHVLICGWNEKVPGLVYTLTGDDAPEKKHVVVVAEMDGDTPLSPYHFDARYVSYCRGDSADFDVLNRANAAHAEAAVVVAGVKKRRGKNVRSILSVLALKHLSQQQGEEMFVAAELIYRENRHYFETCGTDALIFSELMVSRLAALSCLYEGVSDYVIDALTYGSFSNIYAMPFSQVVAEETLKNEGWNAHLFELGRWLAERKCNMVGYMPADTITRGLLGVDGGNEKLVGVFNQTACDYSPRADDRLVIMAERGNPLLKSTSPWSQENYRAAICEGGAVKLRASEVQCVLLVGPYERCQEVAAQLRSYPAQAVSPVILTQDEVEGADEHVFSGALTDGQLWQRAVEERVIDCAIVLSAKGEWLEQGVDLGEDKGDIDARTILLAKSAREYTFNQARPARIIAEMINPRCRSLFVSAGVDTVIPSTVLIERILAKLIYNRGVVTQWLSGLLSLSGGNRLHSQRVEEGDRFCGKCFDELITTCWPNLKVLGWLPAGEQQFLKNAHNDYDTHVITHPSGALTRKPVRAGDLLILAVDA